MAPENNWLSFSLSSVEMELNNPSSQLQSTSSTDSHHFYPFADNFYANNGNFFIYVYVCIYVFIRVLL